MSLLAIATSGEHGFSVTANKYCCLQMKLTDDYARRKHSRTQKRGRRAGLEEINLDLPEADLLLLVRISLDQQDVVLRL